MANIKPDYAEHIFDRWTSCRRTNDKAYWVQFIRACAENLVSACVLTDEDQPIAWTIGYFEGSAGFGYVDPSYRGHSLGAVILFSALQQCLHRNMPWHGFVSASNVAVVNSMQPYFHRLKGSSLFMHHKGTDARISKL